MLDSLYSTLFFPDKPHSLMSLGKAVAILLVVSFVLAFLVAAGRGPVLLISVVLMLWALLVVGLFWFGAILSLVMRLMGSQASQQDILVIAAEARWPLILLAPSMAIGIRLPWLGGFLGFLVWIYGIVCLAGGIRRIEGWSWERAFGALGLTLVFLIVSGLVLLVVPLLISLIA